MLSLLLLPAFASAGRLGRMTHGEEAARGPAASAGDIPALDRLLRRAGWEPTPELSGAFQAGYVFGETQLGHQLVLDDCFESPPIESTYTAAEIVTHLQAGVSVSLGSVGVGSGAGLVKKIKFGTPTHMAIPSLKLIPTTDCASAVLVAAAAGRLDLGRTYVVKEVLRARIAEQTCGHVDAEGSFVALGSAEAELATACSQTSLEPVAVAYRTQAIAELLALAGGPEHPPRAVGSVLEDSPQGAGLMDSEERASPVLGSPAPAGPAELLFLQGTSLFRYREGERDRTLLASDRYASGSYRGRAILGDDGREMYVWGSRGLFWINLATPRFEALTQDHVAVYGAYLLPGDLLLYLRHTSEGKALVLRSTTEGSEVVLSHLSKSSRLAVASGAGRVALSTAQGVVLLRQEDLAHIVEGEVVELGKPLLDELGVVARPHDLQFDPGGEVLHVALGGVDEFGEANQPVTLYRFDAATGRRRAKDRLDVVGGVSLRWDEAAGLIVRSGIPGAAEERREFALDGGRLVDVPAPDRSASWAQPPEDVTIELRLLQGRPQLFAVQGQDDWQITDLRPRSPRMASSLGSYSDSNGRCIAEPGVAWAGWPDGRHLAVFAIDGRCPSEDPAGGAWVSTGRSYLVDILEGPASQIPIELDLGTGLPEGEGIPRDVPADRMVDWTLLNDWSPDGRLLLTPTGQLITREGRVLEVDASHDWASWRE